MNLIQKSARRSRSGRLRAGSLAKLKSSAHRAHRAAVNRTLRTLANNPEAAETADFTPSRSHAVTAWEIW